MGIPIWTKMAQASFTTFPTKWNCIIDDFKSCKSLLCFKNKIIPLVRQPPKSFFGIHDPLGIRYIFQLRLKLSPLRYHKKSYNFADTPSAMCECLTGNEDTNHFLFYCPKFFRQRIHLAVNVLQILTTYDLAHLSNNENVYLYGHHALPHETNRRVLRHTITYIKETNRFNRSDPWSFILRGGRVPVNISCIYSYWLRLLSQTLIVWPAIIKCQVSVLCLCVSSCYLR